VGHRGTVSTRGRPAGRARGEGENFDGKDAHTLELQLPEDVNPFRLRHKREKYAATGGGSPVRLVDSIEPAGAERCVWIQVAAEDSLYVTEDFLLTHNTINAAFIILDEAQNTSPDQLKMLGPR